VDKSIWYHTLLKGLHMYRLIPGKYFLPLQDDDGNAYNTSDEEFDRQLEEAALLEEQAKAEEAAAPKRKTKTKKGRGRGAKKKTKLTNKFPNNDPDAEGYEVC
jgi:hypothetical protein